MSRSFPPVLSSTNFVLEETLKSLINFELIFVSRVRQGSSFILLHMNIQFSQNFKGFDPFSSSLQW